MIFKNKYLKYKDKYLKIKNLQMGGNKERYNFKKLNSTEEILLELDIEYDKDYYKKIIEGLNLTANLIKFLYYGNDYTSLHEIKNYEFPEVIEVIAVGTIQIPLKEPEKQLKHCYAYKTDDDDTIYYTLFPHSSIRRMMLLEEQQVLLPEEPLFEEICFKEYGSHNDSYYYGKAIILEIMINYGITRVNVRDSNNHIIRQMKENWAFLHNIILYYLDKNFSSIWVCDINGFLYNKKPRELKYETNNYFKSDYPSF